MLAAAAAVPPSVPVIGKRVRGVIVKQIPPQLYILLQVGVLIREEV